MMSRLFTQEHRRSAMAMIGLIALLICSGGLHAQQLEVIPLQHRPAELILPALRDVAGPATQLSAAGNQLVVRATAAEMSQLKALIQQLDQPLAQFRISVRQQGQNSQSGRGVDGGYTYNQGQGGLRVGRITLDGRPLPPERTAGTRTTTSNGQHSSTVTVRQYSTRDNSNTTQQLSAVEGYPAYIETGQQVPFLSRHYDRYGHTAEQSYQPVVTGFYVTLSMSGNDRVTLDLATTRQSVAQQSRRGTTVDTVGYQSTINVPLGEWIDLGSTVQSGNHQTAGIAEHRSVHDRDNFNLQLKVDRAR